MAEITKNVFTNGMVLDLSPSATSLTFLTDALNATLVTNNGNELSLLNDMGNARVNNVTLPPGYSPVGTCEYGSIIYVLSVNPENGRSQIGSFPSPEYILSSKDDLEITIKDSEFFTTEEVSYYKSVEDYNESLKGSNVTKTSEELWVSSKASSITKKPTNLYILNPGDSYKISHLSESFKYGEVQPVLLKNDGTQQDLLDLIENIWQYNSDKSSGELALRFELYLLSNFSVTYKINYSDNLENFENFYKVTFNTSYDENEYYEGVLVYIDDECTFFESGKSFSFYTNEKEKTITYKIVPKMTWGLFIQGAKTITIDYSAVNTNTANLNTWKYYTLNETTWLNMDLNLNPSLLREVSKIELIFYDNQGSTAIYTINDREGAYSGSYELSIPLNDSENISELTPISDNKTSEILKDKKVILESEYYHVGTNYYNSEKDELPDNGLTYQLLVADKNKNIYYAEVTKTNGVISLNGGLDINNIIEISSNNVGIIQANYLYACEIRISTVLADGSSDEDDTWQTFYQWFWTNGVYNDYYYDSTVSNVNDKTITLYTDVNTTFTLKEKSTSELDELASNTNEFTAYKNNYPNSDIKQYTNITTYNISKLDSEIGITNHYYTFSLPDDKSNFTINYYAGDDPEFDYELPEIVSNDSEEITTTLPEVTISGKITKGKSIVSTPVTYVNQADEIVTTTSKIDGGEGFTFVGIYNNYEITETTNSSRAITVLEPIVPTLTVLSDTYGIDFTTNTMEQTYSYWHQTDGTGSSTEHFSSINITPGAEGFSADFTIDRDHNEKETNERFITSLSKSYVSNIAHNLTITTYHTKSESGTHEVTDDYNLRANNLKVFWLFNFLSTEHQDSITVRLLNKYNGDGEVFPYFAITPMKRYSDKYENLQAAVHDGASAIAMRDTAGNIHLTNTFTGKGATNRTNLVQEIGSMMFLIYKKKSTLNTQVKRYIYHENSSYSATQLIITVVTPPSNLKPYIFGLPYDNENLTHNVLLNRFGSNNLTPFNIQIVQNAKAFPLTFEIKSHEKNYLDLDSTNVQINTIWGESALTVGDVTSDKLYGYYDGLCYELSDLLVGYLLSYENNTFIKSDKQVVSPNFGLIFEYKSGKLLLTTTEVNESTHEEDCWALMYRDHNSQGLSAGWFDNLKNEILLAGRDYESASVTYGWKQNEGWYSNVIVQ